MAKRAKEKISEEDKKPVNKAGIQKFLGVFKFVLPYRRTFALGLVALCLSTLTLLAFPYFTGQLLDVASGKPGAFLQSINEIALLLLVVLLAQGIFSFVRVYTFSVVSEKSLADLRGKVYQKMLWLPMRFYDQNRVGELMSRLTADVATLQETFSTTLAELIRQVLTLVMGTLLIFYLTPRLTIFMMLTVPVLVILALFFGKFIRKLSRSTQDKLAQANIIVEESLQSIGVVKSYTNEAFESGRYSRALQAVVKVAIKASRYRGVFISFIIFSMFGAIVAITWYGSNLVQKNLLTIGELLSFVLYTTFIGGSIAGLGDIYANLQRAIGASARLIEILNQDDEGLVREGLDIKPVGGITFENVRFSYPGRPETVVVKDLNFAIAPGEKIALIGRSGSGKSTIVNLLMRFYDADGGQIKVDGRALTDYSLTTYRSSIGIVPQEVMLFGGSIRENIAYGKPDATMEEIQQAAEQSNALEFIRSFPEQFDTLVGDRGVKLSGGQRQRIAIARAILKNPAILVLDEATSALDAHSEALVQEALEKLMEGRTTIVIAHRLSTIRKVDRIFVLDRGKLAETGSHQDLLSIENGIYQNLLKLQLQ